jgi:RimJ/RimL family protein N-acetyltransferase
VKHDLVLSTHGIRLEPLGPQHAAGLLALVGDDAMWAGMTSARPTSVGAWEAFVRRELEVEGMMPFAVVGEADDEVRGHTTFYDLVPAQRRVEIGTTFYGRAWWGGVTNPACKYLLLRHAFEEWGLQRVALRADARNTRSRAAIQRLGAQPEGVLRRHRIAADGSTGDTAYFSIVDDEWPAVRDGLLDRLATFA